MLAKIIDSQGNLITIVNKQVVTLQSGQVLDRFIDGNNNIYLERPHNEVIDGIELMNRLIVGANTFYGMQGVKIQMGQT